MILSSTRSDTIASSSFWIPGDVHWVCNWSCAWSFDCSHGKSLHHKWSNSRKFPLFIADTSQISFQLSSWPLTAIFYIAVKIKHSIITCKYFLLILTCSWCALLSCCRTLLSFLSIALNCSHLHDSHFGCVLLTLMASSNSWKQRCILSKLYAGKKYTRLFRHHILAIITFYISQAGIV